MQAIRNAISSIFLRRIMETSELLAHAGFELVAPPCVEFTARPAARGRPVSVPDHLPRLSMETAFAKVQLPLHLNWSVAERVFDLALRADRARVYEIVLQEGRPEDILAYVEGALLVDLREELILPRSVRSAWAEVVGTALGRCRASTEQAR
jgi:hypothetical protein